jgi:hypothetical protein
MTDAAKDAFIRRRVIVNTASNYVAKIMTLGIWFFLTPFLLRQLGASDYGLWSRRAAWWRPRCGFTWDSASWPSY